MSSNGRLLCSFVSLWSRAALSRRCCFSVPMLRSPLLPLSLVLAVIFPHHNVVDKYRGILILKKTVKMLYPTTKRTAPNPKTA